MNLTMLLTRCGSATSVMCLAKTALSSTHLFTHKRSFHLNGNDDALKSTSYRSITSNAKILFLIS
jgi:hypothetical protein